MSEVKRANLPSFFVSGQLQAGQTLALEGADGHKIRNVLRASEGDFVLLRDSSAAAFEAEIITVRPGVEVRVAYRLADSAGDEIEITLAQCLPKSSKMDYVVEKATELGIARLIPVQSERVIGAREGTGKIERWRRLARTAAQQSGGERIPEVDDVTSWDTLLTLLPAYDRVLIPWELADARPRALDTMLDGAKRVLIIIGPEGGLSHHEVERAREYGAVAVSLGRRILRTETAGLMAIACVRYAGGEV